MDDAQLSKCVLAAIPPQGITCEQLFACDTLVHECKVKIIDTLLTLTRGNYTRFSPHQDAMAMVVTKTKQEIGMEKNIESERLLAAIPAVGTTWEVLKERFPKTDPFALAKGVRDLRKSGKLVMSPNFLANPTKITPTEIGVMEVAGDLYALIPLEGITYGELKRRMPTETTEGENTVKLATLFAGQLIQFDRNGELTDDTFISRQQMGSTVTPIRAVRSTTQ